MAAENKSKRIESHFELDVYKLSFETAMKIFELTKSFPREEKYSMVDQMRRSSRSVCANIAEVYRKRRYPAAFVSKLSDADGEAGETQVWLQFAMNCGYLKPEIKDELTKCYDFIMGKLVRMMQRPQDWQV